MNDRLPNAAELTANETEALMLSLSVALAPQRAAADTGRHEACVFWPAAVVVASQFPIESSRLR